MEPLPSHKNLFPSANDMITDGGVKNKMDSHFKISGSNTTAFPTVIIPSEKSLINKDNNCFT